MKIVKSRYMPPFKRFYAINLMGVMFVHPGVEVHDSLLNHERIHTAQMRELGYLPFYLFYVLEWMVRLLFPGNAYRKISFEREAYDHMFDSQYLKHRRHYAWLFGPKRRKKKKYRDIT